MKIRTVVLLLSLAVTLSGCQMWRSALCHPHCRSEQRASSSLVSYLYPSGEQPPRENSVPELKLPVRVGLAFLPSQPASGQGNQGGGGGGALDVSWVALLALLARLAAAEILAQPRSRSAPAQPRTPEPLPRGGPGAATGDRSIRGINRIQAPSTCRAADLARS